MIRRQQRQEKVPCARRWRMHISPHGGAYVHPYLQVSEKLQRERSCWTAVPVLDRKQSQQRCFGRLANISASYDCLWRNSIVIASATYVESLAGTTSYLMGFENLGNEIGGNASLRSVDGCRRNATIDSRSDSVCSWWWLESASTRPSVNAVELSAAISIFGWHPGSGWTTPKDTATASLGNGWSELSAEENEKYFCGTSAVSSLLVDYGLVVGNLSNLLHGWRASSTFDELWAQTWTFLCKFLQNSCCSICQLGSSMVGQPDCWLQCSNGRGHVESHFSGVLSEMHSWSWRKEFSRL